MERKLQVFISSTYTDLKKERQKAVEAILSSGDIPAGMELFQAGDDSQKELIKEWIEESDVYMLLLGGRYGSVDETGISYTEWEYRQAQKLGKPMFALVLTDEYLKAKISDPTDEVDGLEYETNNPAYIQFKEDVMKQIVKPISSLDQIEGAVLGAMNRINKKYGDSLKGWVSADFLDELEKLKEENSELSKKALAKTEEAAELKEASHIIEIEKIGSYNINALVKLLKKINVSSGVSLKDIMITQGHNLVEPKAYQNIHDDLLKEAIPKLVQYGIVESENVEIFDDYNEYGDIVNGYVLSDEGVELLTHLEYLSILEEEEVNNA